jgi:PEP-CTERM motif
MKKSLQISTIIFFVFAFCFSANAAYFITSASDPSLAAGQVITFDTETIGTYTTYITTDPHNNAMIQSLDGIPFRISADYAGQFNNPGQAIENGTYSTGFTANLKFSGPSGGTANAFGFNWGGADTIWTLTAYDISGNVLASYQLPTTGSSNNGEFYGIAATGINYVILSAGSTTDDWVFIDNIEVGTGAGGGTSVPEPTTMLLLGLGLAGVAVARTKFQK